jgi:hypothetical protein
MALSGIGELVGAPLLVVAIWLAGAVYIKVADYWMQIRSEPAGRRGDRPMPLTRDAMQTERRR